uniref:Uncharacterized protein n=1 Tax=Mycobacterium sp. (strain JLS) TaxID=164757 RepID=A0A5Q5CFC0_MYCSJ
MRALRPGAWDLAFADGLVVELDEELHFNRYRLRTLEAPWSARLPWHDAYIVFCERQEQACLDAGRWGKRWTSPPCESMFGPPGEAGVLEGAGTPRWKQRALYDAMKDIAALTSDALHLVRLSLWDTVGDVRLGDALSSSAPIDDERLLELVAQRTTSRPVA